MYRAPLFFVLWLLLSSSSLAVLVPSSCSGSRSCTQQIQAAIKACGSKPCTISFEEGVYLITGNPKHNVFECSGLNQFVFQGKGSDRTIFEMDDIYSLFYVTRSVNLSFQGFTVTMKRLPFTSGTSISSTQIKVDTTLYPVDVSTYPWLNTCQASNQITADGLYRGVDDYFLTDPHAVTFLNNGEIMEVAGVNLPVGQNFIVRHQVYVFNSFSILEVQGVSLKDITLRATAGMGLYTSFCSGVDVENFRVTPTLTPSGASYPMSITADGMHFSNTLGSIRVVNCTLEGQGDDGLNVATDMARITKVNNNKEVVLQGHGGGCPVKQGHIIQIVDGQNLSRKQQVQVLNVVGNVVTLASALAPSVALYDVVYDSTAVASPVLIKQSTFKRNRARGVLAKGYNMVIEDNTFSDNSGPALLFQTDACYFMEGPPLINATVRNNVIYNSDYNQGPGSEEGALTLESYVAFFKNGEPSNSCGDAQTVVNYNITVSSNIFQVGQVESKQLAIQISSTNTLHVENNKISRTGTQVAKEIATAYCSSVVLSGNICNGSPCN